MKKITFGLFVASIAAAASPLVAYAQDTTDVPECILNHMTNIQDLKYYCVREYVKAQAKNLKDVTTPQLISNSRLYFFPISSGADMVNPAQLEITIYNSSSAYILEAYIKLDNKSDGTSAYYLAYADYPIAPFSAGPLTADFDGSVSSSDIFFQQYNWSIRQYLGVTPN